jgi:hypothetical protein
MKEMKKRNTLLSLHCRVCSLIDMGTLRCFTNSEGSVAPSLHRGLPTAVDLIVALPAPIAECIVRRPRSEVLRTPRPA